MSAADIRPLRDVVREHILRALEASHWRAKLAAQHLGITERHVYNKVKEYGINLAECRSQRTIRFRK